MSAPATSPAAGGCQQQYTDAINALGQESITLNDGGLAAEESGIAAQGTALAAEVTANETASDALGDLAVAFLIAGTGLEEASVGVAVPLDAGGTAPGLLAAGGAMDDAAIAAAVLSGTSTAEAVAIGSAITAVATTGGALPRRSPRT